MNGHILRQLILKDLYLSRWLIAGTTLAGLAALAAMPVSEISAYVGGISLICILIVLNIFLVMHNVVQERKEKVSLFVLSLPVSTRQYVRAKVIANALAFIGPWLVLTLGAIVIVHMTKIPNGLLPFWIAVHGYLLLYYCGLLAVGLNAESTGAHVAAITIGNVSFNFVIPLLFAVPSVARSRTGPIAVWAADITTIVTLEIVTALALLAFAVFLRARRGDFV